MIKPASKTRTSKRIELLHKHDLDKVVGGRPTVVILVSHTITSPRDASTGLATGK